MRVWFILLCCVWLSEVRQGRCLDCYGKCEGVTFEFKYYDKQTILNINEADTFSYVKSSNTLFFGYIPDDGKHEHYFANGYYNLDTNNFTEILEVPGGSTTTIDPETEDVFLAGGDGVYKFNQKTKAVERYAAKGAHINSIYFKRNLYYTTFPDFKMYTYSGGDIKKVSEISVQKLCGDENEYFYVNSTGIFMDLDNKEENAIKLADPQVAIPYRGFAKDKNNKIYVVAGDAVYLPNRAEKKLDIIANITGVRGLAFDKDNNIIYSDSRYIFKLTPSNTTCIDE